MQYESVFRSAIEGSDGQVDAGYLALFWSLMTIIAVILAMVFYAGLRLWLDPAHPFDPQGLGTGIGAVGVAFATIVAAVGAFRMGDKPRGGTTVTNVSASETTVAKAG